MHEHISYPEATTQVRTGYIDPFDQTGSDAETPIRDRTEKWRLFYDRDDKTWTAIQPTRIPVPMFLLFEVPDVGLRCEATQFSHTSGTKALAALQCAIYKHEGLS